ncbi:MAG: hypothetical protein Q9227_007695 [Pyrenula ochraceoflavens]
MSSRPTIILVPGAWHSPKSFHKVTSGLVAHGYPVIGVSLASIGGNPPITSIEPDLECVRTAVNTEVTKGSEVIVATHSYGGIVGSTALSGLLKPDRIKTNQPGGVVAIAMIASMALVENEVLNDQLDPKLKSIMADDGTCTMEKDAAIYHFYNGVEQSEAEYWESTLEPHAAVTFNSPLPNRPAWRDVPVHYLVCEKDQALYPYKQHFMADRIGKEKGAKGFVKEVCDAGHSPFLSQPERVVAFLRRAAGENV